MLAMWSKLPEQVRFAVQCLLILALVCFLVGLAINGLRGAVGLALVGPVLGGYLWYETTKRLNGSNSENYGGWDFGGGDCGGGGDGGD